MKKRIPIPGEKRRIQEAIQEVRNKKGAVPREEKEKIAKQIHKKEVKKVKVAIVLGALGISSVAGAISFRKKNSWYIRR